MIWLFILIGAAPTPPAVKVEELLKVPVRPEKKSDAYEKELYKKALSEIRSENWNQSIISMESFAQQNPQSHLADNAIYWMAEIYIQKKEYRLAHDELTRLIRDYPHSDRAPLALKKSSELQTLIQKKESGGNE